MGLLTKEVQVKITSKTYQYYKDLGYDIPMMPANDSSHRRKIRFDPNQIIMVKVDDLSDGSHAIVNTLCDYCNKVETTMEYRTYKKMIKSNGKCSCNKCKKYKTIEHMNNKYGCDWVASTQEFQDKRIATLLNKYGTTNLWDIPGVKEKYEQTNLEKYGKKYFTQTDDYINKTKETNQRKLGVDFPTQSFVIKEKVQASVRDKYGCEHIMQNDEIKNKVHNTLFKHGTGICSKQQKYICELYNGILNYPIGNYLGDIVLLDNMLDIEYLGGGHELSVRLGHISIDDFKQKEIIRDKIIKKMGYKIMSIISIDDKIPSDDILLQMLSDAKQYFFEFPTHSWITFDLNEGIIKNAEYKDGRSYFYGELRKITKRDLESA